MAAIQAHRQSAISAVCRFFQAQDEDHRGLSLSNKETVVTQADRQSSHWLSLLVNFLWGEQGHLITAWQRVPSTNKGNASHSPAEEQHPFHRFATGLHLQRLSMLADNANTMMTKGKRATNPHGHGKPCVHVRQTSSFQRQSLLRSLLLLTARRVSQRLDAVLQSRFPAPLRVSQSVAMSSACIKSTGVEQNRFMIESVHCA
jgi:hypothetical protein